MLKRLSSRRSTPTWTAGLALTLSLASAALYPDQGRSAMQAGMEQGNLGEFDQASTMTGTLNTSTRLAFRGSYSAHSTYHGGGANGYARGIFAPDWRPGQSVRYSSAFRLPDGFYSAMQGQVALMRWDNWPTHGDNGDVGGIVIFGSDHTAHLVRGRYGDEQVTIGDGFRLPEGRWFELEVAQRFSESHPRSKVWVDGRKVVSSKARNFEGRAINRVRFGLVAIGAGNQIKPLDLFFDEARAVTTANRGGKGEKAGPERRSAQAASRHRHASTARG